MQKNYNKLTKQWQISPCKNLGLAPPSCPVPHSDQSLESRLLSCIQTPKKGFQHLHCSQMGPLLDIGVLQGTFFCMWVPFFVQGLRFLQQTKECKKTVKACIFCQLRQELLQPSRPITDPPPPPHFFRSHRSSTLDFHFLSHYSYIKAIMLYKSITGLDVLASWMPHGFDWASLMMTWGHLGHYLGTTWG